MFAALIVWLAGAKLELSDSAKLWVWYCFMVGVSALNIFMLLTLLSKTTAKTSYQKWMKWLAVPWVLECAWRSVFPSLYLQRFVFWNTPLNAIIVDRTLAFVGELSWVFQISLALRQVDVQSSKSGRGTCWIQLSGWLAFIVYVVAEGVSYYNTATTNEFWAAMEVLLEGVSFLAMLPAVVCLCFRLSESSLAKSTGKVFCYVMAIVCILYPAYNIFIDTPMYLNRYEADQQHNKTYFKFWPGIVDATVTRHETHQLSDWSQDMGWMIMYFSLGVWSGLWLMKAPSVAAEDEDQSEKYANKFKDDKALLLAAEKPSTKVAVWM